MVLSLVLHSSHQQQPEQIFVSIVSAGGDLVVNVWHLRIVNKSDLSFMISDQNVGWVETSNETTDDKVQKVSSDEVEWGIVDADH